MHTIIKNEKKRGANISTLRKILILRRFIKGKSVEDEFKKHFPSPK